MTGAGRALLAAMLAFAPMGSASAVELAASYSGLRASGDLVHGVGLGARTREGRLRLLVEASAHSGLSGGEDLRELGLMGGGALVPWAGSRLSPFVSVKGGAVSARRQVEVFGVAIGPDGVCNGGCAYRTGPAAEIGAGLDLRLGSRWALRLPEAGYRVRRLAGETERGLRVSFGIVRR